MNYEMDYDEMRLWDEVLCAAYIKAIKDNYGTPFAGNAEYACEAADALMAARKEHLEWKK